MSETSRQVPELGFWIVTALVAGNMIGSGVFLLPSALAKFGSIGLVAWVLTAIGALLLALVFAKLSRMIPKVGGPYAYCRAGFGDFVGFIIAYNYWIAVWVGNAAIVIALVGYLSVFWPTLSHNNDLEFVVSVAMLWSVTIINIIGIRKAGVVQLATTILKILPLVIIAVVGLFFIHPEYLTSFNLSGKTTLSALTAAASLTLWSFIGLESATVPADSIKDPHKIISRATLVGTGIAAAVYIGSTLVVMGVVPMHILAQSTAPYAEAAKVMFGPWGAWMVAVGAVIACYGALNGWTMLAGQIPMAAARDGLFPKSFALRNRSGAPVYGLIISSMLITALLFFTLNISLIKQFTFIILLATFSSLIPYFFTTMAELMLLYRRREDFNPKRLVISMVIAILAGAYSFWTIVGTGKDVVYYGMLLMLTGVPLYVWVCWRDYSREEASKEVDAMLGE